MRGELPKSDRTLAAYPNSIYPVSLSPKPLFSLKPLCFCGYVDLSPLLAQQHFFVLLQDLALFFFWLFFWHSSSGLWQSPLLFPSSLLPNSTLKNSLWSWSPGELVKMQIWIQLVLCGSQDSAFLTSSQLIRCWTQWSWTLIWVARFYSVRHRQYLLSELGDVFKWLMGACYNGGFLSLGLFLPIIQKRNFLGLTDAKASVPPFSSPVFLADIEVKDGILSHWTWKCPLEKDFLNIVPQRFTFGPTELAWGWILPATLAKMCLKGVF